MSFRRMLPFLLINILVSATVVLSILYWWDSRQAEVTAVQEAAVAAATAPVATETAEAFIEFTPTPDAPATEAAQPKVHVVAAGDTLAKISTIYGVEIDAIMQVNGLSDPNFLQVGQQLVIPIEGVPTETPPPTPTEPAATPPTPIPTEPLTQGEAIIEIKEVIGAGSLSEEAVSIVNTGSRPLALQDWELLDAQGFTYTFGQVTLFGDGAGVLVHTETGNSTALDLYWGIEEAIWEPGETVTLRDPEGTVQATYIVPGESEE